MNQKNNLIIGLIVALVVVASYNVDANPIEFVEGLPNLAIILDEMTELEPELFGDSLLVNAWNYPNGVYWNNRGGRNRISA